MGSFLRSRHGIDYERGFVQGAGRILTAPQGSDWPVGIEELIEIGAGATQYDVVDPWEEVGFTKTGINITRNNAEEDFDVDQVRGSIKRRPSNWEMSVGTQLAEASLETFAIAWELPDPVDITKTAPQLDERHIGLSAPTTYVERQVAVLFQFDSGLIRAWVFRRGLRAAQESGMTLQKTGEQVSLPVRWNALADSDQDVDEQFGEIFEQVPAGP
jgi:hypothetical protein